MKQIFLLSVGLFILSEFSFSQTKSKEEIESWIISKLNAFIPKSKESQYKNKDNETIIETISEQRFYFEKGYLMRYASVMKNKEDDLTESVHYKVKGYLPICYYEKIEEKGMPKFTIWTNKTASIKILRYDRSVLTVYSKCDNGFYSGKINDETEFVKGLNIVDVTSWEDNLLERLNKAFTDLKKYYPVPQEAY